MSRNSIILSAGVVSVLIVAGLYFMFGFSGGRPEPAGSEKTKSAVGAATEKENGMHAVTIETTKGAFRFMTYDADAPKAVENFITLAGKKFYDGLTFHRVIPGFMIQGGDPFGNGTGGPGYTFEDELNPETESYKNGYTRGAVAMANAGSNTNGSQFFIMHKDYALPHNYTIFGKVIEGMEVVDAITALQTDEQDKPLTAVVMKRVTVEEK